MLFPIGAVSFVLAQVFLPVTPTPIPTAPPTATPAPVVTMAPATGGTIPAHTLIPVRLTQMLSSHDAQTGQKFAFILDQNVLLNGAVVIPKCTRGSGTVTFAGQHGIRGHEGNLHLRFEALTLSDGTSIALDPNEQQFNGKSRRALAFFVSNLFNGDEVEVHTGQVLNVSLLKDTPVHPGLTATCPAPEPN